MVVEGWRQTGGTSCSVEWPGTVDMKVMKVGLGITYGVKMNCGLVSAGVTARTNRKHNNVELGITFGWTHGVKL